MKSQQENLLRRENPLGWYSKHLIKNWLKKYGFIFNEIYYCSESHSPTDKLDACRKLQVDVMIDDKPEVALHLAENGIKVLLFDTRYNQKIEHDNNRKSL